MNVNLQGKLTFETIGSGLDVPNLGGRMPIWLDYDNDHRLDVFLAQYDGAAQLFHQNSDGTFTDVTGATNVHCTRFHYAQLIDVTGDGHLDVMCPDEVNFPQKIYDPSTFPWKKPIFLDSTACQSRIIFPPTGPQRCRFRDRGFQQ